MTDEFISILKDMKYRFPLVSDLLPSSIPVIVEMYLYVSTVVFTVRPELLKHVHLQFFLRL